MRAASLSANGVRSESNNYLLDGIDNNNDSQDFLNGTFYVALPPVDAIAEFKVETANYSAGFRAGRRRCPKCHGQASISFMGTFGSFCATISWMRQIFSTTPPKSEKESSAKTSSVLPPVDQSRKTKHSCSGDYQGTRIRQALVYRATVPTPLMRSSGYSNFSDLFSQSTGTVSDSLGRTFRVGQVFDPATTRPVTAGQIDPVTRCGQPAPVTSAIRLPGI